MNIHKYLISLSIVLFSAGVALAVPLSISRLEQQKAPSAVPSVTVTPPPTVVSEKPAIISGVPRHIAIPSLGISLPVADGVYDASTSTWTLSDNYAFFATPTTPVNSDSGNTLIYGHATQRIFGQLPNLQVGADVVITTDNGYIFTYTYKTSEIVSPTNVSILNYNGASRLTLQTCSGVWSENRHLFYFELKEYHKS